MKQRRFPLWFVCDVTCFIGVIAAFWPLMIAFHAAFVRVMKTKARRIAPDDFDLLRLLLVRAEAQQALALWRQAFRLSGLNPGSVRYQPPSPPTDQRSFLKRFDAWRRRCLDLDAAARRLAATLQRRLTAGSPRLDRSASLALCAAEPVRALSGAQDGMPRRSAAKAGGGSRAMLRSRGPPVPSAARNSNLRAPQAMPARSRAFA